MRSRWQPTALAAHGLPGPPSPVASGRGIPMGRDRSKAGGHTRRHTPPGRRRPIPSQWPAGSPADAGNDRVLKPEGPFPAARGSWSVWTGFSALCVSSHAPRISSKSCVNGPFSGAVLLFPAPHGGGPRAPAGCSHLALIRFLRRGSPALKTSRSSYGAGVASALMVSGDDSKFFYNQDA